MRRFQLHRVEDVTGVSGTGIVAEGVVFSDGTVAMKWLSEKPSTVLHDSIDNVQAIHGHGGSTKIFWLDWDESMLMVSSPCDHEAGICHGHSSRLFYGKSQDYSIRTETNS